MMNNVESKISIAESQYIEFKAESVKAMDLAEEIVAFANSEGGEICSITTL